jgi:3D (Asp-Asp-Asp) domain-containing protein
MKKHCISLLLSVTLIAVTLPQVSANVVADREITVENSTHENVNVEDETKVNDIENKPMTAKLEGRTITYDSVKTEESMVKNRQDINPNNIIASRGSNEVQEVEFTLSFYSTLKSENGNWTVTCQGTPLKGLENAVASNIHPLGTKIYLEGLNETVTVLDKGGKDFNSYHRLDVLVQRERKDNGQWESDKEYIKRVNDMGKVKVKGYILK